MPNKEESSSFLLIVFPLTRINIPPVITRVMPIYLIRQANITAAVAIPNSLLYLSGSERYLPIARRNMDEKNMAIEWAPVIISKTCYSESLCEAVFGFIEQFLAQTGAEYVFALVPVFDRSMQTLLKKLGFTVRGVIPGLILAWAGDESYCRNSIVYMDKFYHDGQKLAVEPKDLIPEAKAVYRK